MLVITTTVRMVHRVHSNTTSAGPVVTFSLVLVVCPSSLQQRLIDPPTTRDDANCRPGTASDSLLCTTRQTNAGLVLIRGVSDHGSVVPGCPCECAAVTDFLLDVADDGAFGALADGEDVSNGESRFFAAVDEGAGVHTFCGDECFFTEFVAVWVTEDYLGKGCTSASVVDDVLYDTPDVSISFGEIEVAQTGRGFVVVRVRLEDGV